MKESVKTIGNIDELDKGIIKELGDQTKTLQDTQKHVDNANEYYNKSNTVIRNMLTRVFTNKLVLFSIIILLGLLILFLLYIKIKYKILGEKK